MVNKRRLGYDIGKFFQSNKPMKASHAHVSINRGLPYKLLGIIFLIKGCL